MNKYYFENADKLIKLTEKYNVKISEVVLNYSIEDEERDEKYFLDEMKRRYVIMKEAVANGIKITTRSKSGLSGGDANKLNKVDPKNTFLGKNVFNAVKYAFAIQEHNARFGRVVAFPTAGSAGTVPSVLISYQEANKLSDEEVIKALFTAAGIGMIIGENASLAGASGGCQAEVGSASAMAAGALTELRGGNPTQVFDSAAIALKGMLGLVCDPIGGLVEAPCVKRNATAVSNACMASEIVMAGVESNVNFDQVVVALKNIGDRMSSDFKETAKGGLAITKKGYEVNRKIGLNFPQNGCGKCMMCR